MPETVEGIMSTLCFELPLLAFHLGFSIVARRRDHTQV